MESPDLYRRKGDLHLPVANVDILPQLAPSESFVVTALNLWGLMPFRTKGPFCHIDSGHCFPGRRLGQNKSAHVKTAAAGLKSLSLVSRRC